MKSGVYTALITPFLPDGKIDWNAFSRLIDQQVKACVQGIVLCGTTGEGSSLTIQEKLSLIKRARSMISGGIELMAGAGLVSTEQTIELCKLSIDAGADSLLIVTPPYVKPNPSGLLTHFSQICQSVDKDICLYHIPGRTGQRLSEDMLARLCELKQISSIKEATADLFFISRLANLSKKPNILSGDDLTFLPSLSVGATGVISVISNVLPKEFLALYNVFKKADNKTALDIHQALIPLLEALFVESNPAPVKALMAHLGMCGPTLRSPLGPISEDSHSLLMKAYLETQKRLELLL